MWGDIGGDIRFAWRSIVRRPGFTALAVLTLAIGIGANTMVFSMTNQALFRPLAGIRDPGGADYIELLDGATGRPRSLSAVNFEDMRSAATLWQRMGGYRLTSFYASADEGMPVEVLAQIVTGDYFGVLGVTPAAGRLLRPEETLPHADPSLVVISERLWAALFDRAPDVVGRQIRVNGGQSLTVIGVAGGGFAGVWREETINAWVPPSALTTLTNSDPSSLDLRSRQLTDQFVGRLEPGITVAAASAQLRQVIGRLADAHPDDNEYLRDSSPRILEGLAVRPLIRERTESIVRILLGIVAAVLIIACANVANLLLLRGSRRRSEIAVRRALGASRARVFRQLMTESLLISAMGGVAGLVLAFVLARFFRGASFIRLPPFEGLAPDGRVLSYTLLAVLITTILGGAIPAVLAGRADFVAPLKEAGGRETGRRAILRSAITVVQLALSLSLLVGALLLARTVRNLYSVDLGLDPAPLVAFTLSALPLHYSAEQNDALYRRVYDTLNDVPGVDAVAFDMYGPFYGGSMLTMLAPPGDAGPPIRVENRFATPGYFETLGIPLASGRSFRSGDWGEPGTNNVVLTRALARRLFGEADPIGRTLSSASQRSPETWTVIGVTGDLHLQSPAGPPDETMFTSIGSLPLPLVTVVVRTRSPGAQLNQALREAVFSAAPDIPMPDPVRLSEKLDERVGEPRLFARLLSVLSALAVFLATIGLYGVIAWGVTERTREIGIRRALGARLGAIVRLILAGASTMVAVGILLGLGGAVGVARLVENQLFGVGPLDVASYGAAAAFFIVVALVACLVPIRAAASVDPANTLRQD